MPNLEKRKGFESIKVYLILHLFMSIDLMFPSMKDMCSLSGNLINSSFDPQFFHYPNIGLNYTERDLRRFAPLKTIGFHERPVVISKNVDWRILILDLEKRRKLNDRKFHNRIEVSRAQCCSG